METLAMKFRSQCYTVELATGHCMTYSNSLFSRTYRLQNSLPRFYFDTKILKNLNSAPTAINCLLKPIFVIRSPRFSSLKPSHSFTYVEIPRMNALQNNCHVVWQLGFTVLLSNRLDVTVCSIIIVSFLPLLARGTPF